LELKLTQEELAQKFKVDWTTIGNYESGRSSPKVSLVPKLIEFIGYDPRPVPTEFPSRLKWVRQGLGLTQRALAERIGADVDSVMNWEAGKTKPAERFRAALNALSSNPMFTNL
jgi:DNA-binding XRE family transcriptional regulator